MKKIAFLSLGFCAVCMSAVASSPELPPAHQMLMDSNGWPPSFKTDYPKPKSWDDEDDGWQLVFADQLTDQEIKRILQGEVPNTTIEFVAGSLIPLRLNLTGDLLSLHETSGSKNSAVLEVQQTLYVRYANEQLIFSTDLNEWKSFFEFVTGEVNTTVSVEDGQSVIVIDAELNRRS